VVGFNVYRSTGTNPGIRLNAALLPATGGAAVGARYVLHDRPGPGTYHYRLEVVNQGGPLEHFGPVVARSEGSQVMLPIAFRMR
jgi:hypothetical protein